MYLIPLPYSPGSPSSSEVVNLVYLVRQAAEWIIVYLGVGDTQLSQIQWKWPKRVDWEYIFKCLRPILHHLAEWPVHAFHAAKWFFVAHTHIVYVVSLSIFFGPIAILIPLLFLHELVFAILFNLSFIFHGLLPGTVDDHYLYLHSIFQDLKEFSFSCVDRLGARYNKLTTEHWPLVVVRLSCLGLGGLALYCIVSESLSRQTTV